VQIGTIDALFRSPVKAMAGQALRSPVSTRTVQPMAALGEVVGRELEPLRFRPTIVVDVPGVVRTGDPIVLVG
jgi:hypothetical protein